MFRYKYMYFNQLIIRKTNQDTLLNKRRHARFINLHFWWLWTVNLSCFSSILEARRQKGWTFIVLANSPNHHVEKHKIRLLIDRIKYEKIIVFADTFALNASFSLLLNWVTQIFQPVLRLISTRLPLLVSSNFRLKTFEWFQKHSYIF